MLVLTVCYSNIQYIFNVFIFSTLGRDKMLTTHFYVSLAPITDL